MILICTILLLALMGGLVLTALLGYIKWPRATIFICIAAAIILALGMVKLFDTFESREDYTDPVEPDVTESQITATTSPATTETVTFDTTEPIQQPEPLPDYAAMAENAFCMITESAAAAVQSAPMGTSFDIIPFERSDYYSPLTHQQKSYYDEMFVAVEALENRVWRAVDGHPLDDIRVAADALAAARPDMQCYFTLTEIGEGECVTALELRYFIPSDGTDVTHGDKSQIAVDMAYFEAVCDYIVESMPRNISTYDKYRYLASVVSLTTQYDRNYEYYYNNATAYGGILGGYTICRGYSIAFEYLCARADMYCGRVEGESFLNNIHMWNIAALDTGTYHIDVTWSDNGVNKPCDKAWMKYFMLTQQQVFRDHIISDGTIATGT